MEVCEPVYISTFTRHQILIHVSRFYWGIASSKKAFIFKLCQQVRTLTKNLQLPTAHVYTSDEGKTRLGRCISHQKCLEGVLRGGYAGFMLGKVSADLVPRTTALQPLVERCRILDHVSCDSDNLLQATLSFNLKLFTCCSIRARRVMLDVFCFQRNITHSANFSFNRQKSIKYSAFLWKDKRRRRVHII